MGFRFFISEGCPAAKNLIVFTMCSQSSIPQCFTVNSISFLQLISYFLVTAADALYFPFTTPFGSFT